MRRASRRISGNVTIKTADIPCTDYPYLTDNIRRNLLESDVNRHNHIKDLYDDVINPLTSLMIYDVMGNLLLVSDNSENTNELYFTLPHGTYILNFIFNDGTMITKKIIK